MHENMKITFALFTLGVIGFTLARKGLGPNEQEWGYITVRPKAHIFWWLHQTTAKVQSYTERPLVIWLQGGPGASSTGFGNFHEIGPVDDHFNKRNSSWVQDVNVLFVDNPVGTGFSYVESKDALTKNSREIAEDFLVFLQEFYRTIPELKDTPLYIFAESYGGKMAAEIALVVHEAVENGTIEVNLEGIGLGDAWISPIDSVLSWGLYLRQLGFLEEKAYNKVQNAAEATARAVKSGKFLLATDLWGYTEKVIFEETQGVDFYNVLTKVSPNSPFSRNFFQYDNLREKRSNNNIPDDIDRLKIFMNNEVKNALNLKQDHFLQSSEVFRTLAHDFMKPVTEIVEKLLNKTDIKVAVFNGQLDLIVDTPGTETWVNNLKFPQAKEYEEKVREAIVVDGIVEGFHKNAGNLYMYWVNRAGHMVPADNPSAMKFILSEMIDNFN